MMESLPDRSEKQERSSPLSVRLFHEIFDLSFVLDLRGHFLEISPRTAEAFNFSPEKMLGTSLWNLVTDEATNRSFSLALRSQKNEHFEAYFPLHKKWFEFHTCAESEKLYVYFRDITERKDSSENGERISADLQRVSEELEKFAYITSHDLQEPLRIISSYVSLIKNRYVTQLDSTANEFIDYAVEGTKRMKVLIEDLLLYARTGNATSMLASCDLNAVVDEALNGLKLVIQDTKAVVERTSLPLVRGDHPQLVQLFHNLFANALKFRRDTPLIRIRSATHLDPKFWLIDVCDNGIGFDMRFSSQVFDLFRRLHSRSEYSGTGLGLALCKKIVNRHGGIIWADSQLNVGTSFKFILPRA